VSLLSEAIQDHLGGGKISADQGATPTRELHRLVGDVDTFRASVWQQVSFLHRGADADGPVDLDDVDELLAGTALRLPYLAMCGNGEDLPPSTYTRIVEVTGVPMFGVVDADKVCRHLRAGNTLALFMLDHLLPRVRRYCRRLSKDLGAHCSVGAYLSPDGQHAFSIHTDQEDKFIWQLAGTKKWTVWNHFPDYRRRRVTEADLGEPVLEIELGPGDCLYVPRGTPHLVEPRDSLSLHLTISARVWTIRDELLESVRTVLDNPEFDVVPDRRPMRTRDDEDPVASLSRLLIETRQGRSGSPRRAPSRASPLTVGV
jgi:bifunctional lysine-specific demethylase and histidyl-hydroxylase NO66